jgi:hypothetical protein
VQHDHHPLKTYAVCFSGLELFTKNSLINNLDLKGVGYFGTKDFAL